MSIMLSVAGASMLTGSVYGMYKRLPGNQLRSIIRNTLITLDPSEDSYLKRIRIVDVSREGNVFTVTMKLPAGFSSDECQSIVKYLEESSFAGDTRFKHVRGNIVSVVFGYEPFEEKMEYRTDLIDPERPLAVPLYSPFGTLYIDFGEESTCHLLNGGATRMGKSVFLRLLIMHIMLATKGEVKFYCIDNKITDLYMFRDIPQIQDAETADEALRCLKEVRREAENRKALLKKAGDVNDAKSYRKKYPNSKMYPIFVVIDEYARFADEDAIQDEVTFLAETAGYVDIHLVIASQRPDVKDVLKPRIRTNMLARLAFSTPDEANSKIILDLPDAAYLGRIKGRAIYSDGFPNKVQVPYIEADAARVLLKPYIKNGWWNIREQPGRKDHSVPAALQNPEPRPLGDLGSFGQFEPASDHKPRSKKTRKGGSNPAGSQN